MSAHRIAARYAKSLLDLGIERDELDQILKDIDYVRACLTSRDLYLLIKSPIVSVRKKKSVFRRIFDGKLSHTISHFFEIMIRKGRENILPEILDSFVEQYKDFKGISTVVLKTAVELDKETISQIKSALLQSKSTKENIELVVEVDPSLIGGFTLQYEGKEYDTSLVSKLDNMRKQFSSN